MMEEILLNDKSLAPNDELISSILGETILLWNQTFSYLFDNHRDISVEWKFTCGKEWNCQVRKKKKTLFWIRITRKNAFSVGFPFGNKLESIILESGLPESIKNTYMNATSYGSTRYIAIVVENSSDFENVKKLIALKANN